MFKLLVLSCLLVSCLADPSDLPPRFREAGHQHRYPQGCANRVEGWRACARLNSSDSLAPHGLDCSLFFYCTEGSRPACRQCPAGLHFNPQLQVCDWPENVNCVPRPHHNGTTPYPTTLTTSNDATITVIDVSTTTSTEGTTPITEGSSPTTDGTSPTTDGTSPTTDGTSTATDGTSTTTDGISTSTDGTSTTAEPSVFSWGNYIPWGRK